MQTASNSALQKLQYALDILNLDINRMPSPEAEYQSKIIHEGEFYVSNGFSNSFKRWCILYEDKLQVLESFRHRKILHSISLEHSVYISGQEDLLQNGVMVDTGYQRFAFRSTKQELLISWLNALSKTCTIVEPIIKKMSRSASSPSIWRAEARQSRTLSVRSRDSLVIQNYRSRSRSENTKSGSYSESQPSRLFVNCSTPESSLPSPCSSRSSTKTSYPLPPLEEDCVVAHEFPIEEFYGTEKVCKSPKESRIRKLSFLGNMLNNVGKE